MNMRIFRCRPIRSFAVLASGVVLALAVGAAAPRDALAATQVAAAARAAAAGGTWGPAQVVAGALNTGGFAQVNSVSCASAGNWSAAHPVAAALNKGGIAAISSVSCGSPGNCSAGGFYTDKSGFKGAFVV